MSNTMLTSLTNALTEIANRRADLRMGERPAVRDGGDPENFGSMVSEWAQSAPAPLRQDARPVPPRESAQDTTPRTNTAPEEMTPPRTRPEKGPRTRPDKKEEEAGDPPVTRANERRPADEARDTRCETDTEEPSSEETGEAEAETTASGDKDAATAKAEGEETVAAENAAAPQGEGVEAVADEAVIVAIGTPADAEGIVAAPAVAAATGETPAEGEAAAVTGIAAVATKAAGEAPLANEAAKLLAKEAGAGAAATKAESEAVTTAATDETGTTLATAATDAATKTAKATETGTAATGAEAKAQAAGQGHHPVRTTPFAELFHGMGTQNAIYRPADILAGLDRSLPAANLGQAETTAIRPTPLQMLPIEIGMQAVRGVTNFQIRLDPAELGRVDVKLQIKENGEVNASLVVDRVETLQMLRRDASTLQQAFEQAGLKQSADGLTFSLRGEGQSGQQQERGRQGPSQQGLDDIGLQPQMGELVMRRALIPNTSLDLMI